MNDLYMEYQTISIGKRNDSEKLRTSFVLKRQIESRDRGAKLLEELRLNYDSRYFSQPIATD